LPTTRSEKAGAKEKSAKGRALLQEWKEAPGSLMVYLSTVSRPKGTAFPYPSCHYTWTKNWPFGSYHIAMVTYIFKEKMFFLINKHLFLI